MQIEKKIYEKPSLVKHDQLRKVTLRSGQGGPPTVSPSN